MRRPFPPIHRALSLGLAALLVWGCDGPPPPPGDDPFPEIREVWQRDPARAMTMVNELPGELEQLTAVEAVMRPWRDRELVERNAEIAHCAALERPAVRQRCERTLARDHLASFEAEAPAEHDAELRCLAALPGGEAVSDTPLGTAIRMASPGRPLPMADALKPCACLSLDKDRQECHFRLAESLAGVPGRSGDAIETCLLTSTVIASGCLEHILRHGRVAGPLDRADDPRWLELAAWARLIEAAPSAASADLEFDLAAYFWAAVLFRSAAGSLEPGQPGIRMDPALAGALPDDASIYLHDAAAWLAVAMQPIHEPLQLDAAVALAGQLLAGEAPVAPLTDARGDNVYHEPQPRCAQQLERSEEHDHTQHFLGQLACSRVASKDPEIDLQLAVKAAAACQGRP